MKKNKKGFTLAEILITLGIVGVISALVLPQISKVNDKTFEPTRERTINVLQEGFAKLLHQAQQGNDDAMTTMLSAITYRDLRIEHNPNTLAIVQPGDTNLFDQCQGQLGIVPVQMTAAERTAYFNSMHWLNAQNQEQSLITRYPRLRTAVVYKFAKINSVIIFEPFEGSNFANEHAVIARIFIDADGTEGRNLLDAPNQSKRGDIGVYGLGNDGFIYRDNSEECQAYDGGCRKP